MLREKKLKTRRIEELNFFVVDIETTGTNSRTDRITDIAAVHLRDGEILRTYDSLVNPRRPIPEFIQNMTGITHDLVKNAPNDYDVLSEFKEFVNTENAIFVAHNANFDYHFVRNTSIRLFGEPLDFEVLCTVKLARKLLPKTQKVNLTALAEYFEIPIFMRHRALGDAFATARALIRMLEILESEHNLVLFSELTEFKKKGRKRLRVNNFQQTNFIEKINKIPDCQGVYYLYDKFGTLLHSGKSENIRKKLLSFFDSQCLCSEKMKKILEATDSIDYKDTLTTLHSELLLLDPVADEKPLSLFDTEIEYNENLVYVDTNNSKGKTVSVFFIKDGLLVDHIEIGKSATSDIIEQMYFDIYQNNRQESISNKNQTHIIRKWLSREPDLGNKFRVEGDKKSVLERIKNYIRSVY